MSAYNLKIGSQNSVQCIDSGGNLSDFMVAESKLTHISFKMLLFKQINTKPSMSWRVGGSYSPLISRICYLFLTSAKAVTLQTL